MGFIWPSSIIGILPLAPESVSSNSFPIHRWILRMKFLFGKNFFVYSSSYFFRLLFLFFFFFFFLFSKESVLGLLDIEPTTYVFLPLLYTLITSGGYLFRAVVYNFSIWIDARIEFAFLLKSCCWILS